ncbi:MAG: hypothetical protein ACSLFK_12165 [Gemmatimonadaceae bacterium]
MRNQLRTLMTAWRETNYGKLQAADHRGWSYDKLAAQLSSATDYTVIGGPYRGMRYFGEPRIPIVDNSPTAKLIGSFEEELHPWIERLIERGFSDVIFIGGGEGYHAVGMARRMELSRFVVFDTLIAARQACNQLAEQNAVKSRMQLRGFCGAEAFYDLEIAGSLIFSDCGGAELALLDPVLYPALRTATLLVETHDLFDARITSRLVSKFRQTHNIEFTEAAPRDPAKYLLPGNLSLDSVKVALDEQRKPTGDGKPQRWALLTPISS